MKISSKMVRLAFKISRRSSLLGVSAPIDLGLIPWSWENDALNALLSLRRAHGYQRLAGVAGAILKEATACGVASLRVQMARDARSAVAKGREQDNEVLELGDAIAVHIAVRRAPG